MKTAFITGEKVYLRPLERGDLNETYLGWLNDPEVNRYLEAGQSTHTIPTLEQYYDQITGASNTRFMAVVVNDSDLHIGNVKLEPINWNHGTAVFGIMIGDKSKWGQGYGTEATRLAIEYAFEQLNLRKVSLGVVISNTAAVKTYERLGFVNEGTKRQELLMAGKYEDVYWMGLLRDEYQASKPGTDEQRH